jgi:hypothetical protein
VRAPAVAVVALLFLFAPTLGCATRFESGPLTPIPQAAAAPGLPYAQVRQYGLSSELHWIGLRFDGGDRRRHAAVTVDVRNDTTGPLLLELSRAHLRHQASGKLAAQPVVAAGFGDVPAAIDLESPGEPALELAPGASSTIWLAFAPLSRKEAALGPGRVELVVPVTATGDVVVPLHDSTASPAWTPRLTSAFGLTMGTSASFFDNARGRFNQLELAAFVARGPLTASLTAGGFTLHERLRGGIAHASGPSLGVDLALRPLDFTAGLFASANYLGVDFDQSSGEPDRSLLGTTLGVVLPLEGGIAPAASLRLGYTYLWGDRSPYHGGLYASLNVRLFYD